MSKKKRIRRMLSIFLIASMVLSYNSSCFLSVWAAADDTPAAEEEMKADPEQTEDTEDAGEVSEPEQQPESEDAIEQDESAPAEEAAADDAEEETAVQEDPEEKTDAAAEEEAVQEEPEEATEAAAEEEAVQEKPEEATEAAAEEEAVQEKPEEATETAAEEDKAQEEPEEVADAGDPVKDRYTYKDSRIKVTAVLDDASAIPDDAELVVTPVTKDSKGYNYDAYMEALNKDSASSDAKNEGGVKGFLQKHFKAEKEEVSEAYSEDNTLLYDIAFIVNENGKNIEVQPESGKVKIKVSFVKDQLTEVLGAESADDIKVVHLPLSTEVTAANDTTSQATKIG